MPVSRTLRSLSRPALRVWAPLVGVALAAGSCSFPTDASTGTWVSVSAPSPVLIRGRETRLVAHAWRRGPSGDSTEIRNVDLVWSSTDTRLATVIAEGGGIGRVTGVNPGIVELRAVAGGLESGRPGVFRLRVANPLEIDSIGPDTVRYGERLRMYGVGVGSLYFAGLGPGFLSADSTSAVGGDGMGRIDFWVPWPARTGHVFAAGSGQIVSAPTETVVLPWDLYEPNEQTPAVIDLDGPPPFPRIPILRFANPALAYEDLRDFPYGYDWYRFRTSATTPHSLILYAPSLGGAHVSYLAAANGAGWTIGTGRYACKGTKFEVGEAPSDSLVVALKRMPTGAGAVDLFSAYVQEGQYILAVVGGYLTADPRLAPDRFEENDTCDFADENFLDPALRIDAVNRPLADTLNIDNAHDVDWFRFRVSGVVPQTVTVRSRPRPFGAVDRSDIDLHILAVPTAVRGLDRIASDSGAGSNAALTVTLDPGDYYLAVTDRAGVPTRYALCLAAGATCTLPAEPPAPLPAIAPASDAANVLSAFLAAARRPAPPGAAPATTRERGTRRPR